MSREEVEIQERADLPMVQEPKSSSLLVSLPASSSFVSLTNHQLLKLHQDLVHLSRILTWNWVTMAPHQFSIKGYLAVQKELRSVELVSTKISNLTASQLL